EGKAIVAAQEQVERFAAEARQHFGSYLLIGIGGSALGPQFVANAFREPGRTPPIFYFDNTDPEGFTRTLRDIAHAGGLGKTLAIVVSKSGGTPESRNGMLVAQRTYQDAKLDFAKHAVAVTVPGSGLDKQAAGWLARFPIWEWVGGRTSLF